MYLNLQSVHYVVTNIYTDYNEDLSPKLTVFSSPEQMEIVAVSDSLEAEQVVTHLFDKFEYFKYFGDMNLDGDDELLLNPIVWRYISLKNTKPAPKPKLTKKEIEKLLGYKIDIID